MPKIVARVLEQKWMVRSEVCVVKMATIRERSTHTMSSGDVLSSQARSGSAKASDRVCKSSEILRRAAAVAFQESTESLLATNLDKRNDLAFDSNSFGR